MGSEECTRAGATLPGPAWSPMAAITGSFCSLGIILWGNDPQMGPAASIPPHTSSQSLVRSAPALNSLAPPQSLRQGFSELEGPLRSLHTEKEPVAQGGRGRCLRLPCSWRSTLLRLCSLGLGAGQVGVSDYLHPLPQVRSDQWLTKVGGLCQAERGHGWVGWGDTGICKTGPLLWSPVLGPEA